MGLGSVLHTALTGISAAELTIGSVSHNLANLSTVGFKQSFPVFATHRSAMRSTGRPGGNPQQVGSGVQTAAISTDFSQGTTADVVHPGQRGSATITSDAIELSNTDISRNLVESILASTQLRLGASVIGIADEMLDELVNLR